MVEQCLTVSTLGPAGVTVIHFNVLVFLVLSLIHAAHILITALHNFVLARANGCVFQSYTAIEIEATMIVITLLKISISIIDRTHIACACEPYSQQTVSTHQRGASS